MTDLIVTQNKLAVLFPIQDEVVLESGFIIPREAEAIGETFSKKERAVKCTVISSGMRDVWPGQTVAMRMGFGHTALTQSDLVDLPDGYEYRIYEHPEIHKALVGVLA
jgi:hypothetical protein